MVHTFNKKGHSINFLTYLSLLSMLVSLTMLLAGVIGFRYGLYSLNFSLLFLTKWGACFSILTICICFTAFGNFLRKNFNFKNFILIIFPLFVSSLIIIAFYNYNSIKNSSPLLNDISTDYDDSIKFYKYTDHNLKNNENAFSLQNYGGFKQPYKSIKSLMLNVDKNKVFERSLEFIDIMGMEIVYINKKDGIIEAVDTSFWYGFKDDSVVRIEDLISGMVKVDARSASRMGRADFAVNSERIKSFFVMLQDSL